MAIILADEPAGIASSAYARPHCAHAEQDEQSTRKALQAAVDFINADKKAAADVFMASSEGKGWKVEDVMEVLNDPDIRFTTSPESVMKYASFMADVGSIKLRPATWQEMFFPDIHGVPGN